MACLPSDPPGESRWRARFPVLVPQAESLGAVAVIRSLGRAGYPVYACSTHRGALGLRSNFARATAVSPPYRSPQFLPWLRRIIDDEAIRAIVASESLLHALRGDFEEFAPLLPCAPPKDVLFAGLSKLDVLAGLRRSSPGAPSAAAHLPPTILVPHTDAPPSREALDRLGPPLYLKVDAADARAGQSGDVVKVDSAEEALAALGRLARTYRRALVQGHVPGAGVGAFFLLDQGRVLAEFMHRRLHEVPYTGGASSYRESFFHREIRDDALMKLRHLSWRGVAMMEYRWDEGTNRFHFLELNGRFWGSLHLALHAGVDFPRLLLDAFAGRPGAPVCEYPLGVRCRHTFPAELEHLWSKLKDPRLAACAKLGSIVEFGLLGSDPRVRSDLWFPGDRGLYWRALAQTSVRYWELVAGRARRRNLAARTPEAGLSVREQVVRALPRVAPDHAR